MVNGAEFEIPDELAGKNFGDPKAFVESNLSCPLVFFSFDKNDLAQVFDSDWLEEIDFEEGVKPDSVSVGFAEINGSSIEFEVKVVYSVKLLNKNVDDDVFQDKLSWASGLIDSIRLSYEDFEFEELGIGEKIGPSVV